MESWKILCILVLNETLKASDESYNNDENYAIAGGQVVKLYGHWPTRKPSLEVAPTILVHWYPQAAKNMSRRNVQKGNILACDRQLWPMNLYFVLGKWYRYGQDE